MSKQAHRYAPRTPQAIRTALASRESLAEMVDRFDDDDDVWSTEKNRAYRNLLSVWSTSTATR